MLCLLKDKIEKDHISTKGPLEILYMNLFVLLGPNGLMEDIMGLQ